MSQIHLHNPNANMRVQIINPYFVLFVELRFYALLNCEVKNIRIPVALTALLNSVEICCL